MSELRKHIEASKDKYTFLSKDEIVKKIDELKLLASKLSVHHLTYAHSMIIFSGNNDFYSCMVTGQADIKAMVELPKETEFHSHSYVEIGYVVDGKLIQQIEESRLELSKGDVFIIDKYVNHRELDYNNSMVFYLGINNDFFVNDSIINVQNAYSKFIRDIILYSKINYRCLVFNDNKNQLLFDNTLKNMFDEMTDKMPFSDGIIQNLISRILFLLFSDFDVKTIGKELKDNKKLIYSQIIKYIYENYATITLNDLSKEFNYSSDHLNRLIKKTTGATYSQFVSQIRIDKAKSLLITTKKPINMIVNDIGYENATFFYRLFYKMENTTPNQYRILNTKV